MFKTPCYIRKNTPELRGRLEEFGYENRNRNDYIGNTICTLPYSPLCSNNREPQYMCFLLDDDFLKVIAPTENMFDCSDNEELFLALVALRDDSDYMQWFVSDEGNWYLCEEPNFEVSLHMLSPVDMIFAHKASVKEIIKHFNK